MRSVFSSPRLTTILPWGAVALALAFGLRLMDNPDSWWHLASGRWIIEHGAVQATDPFSFTVPGSEWINLQWLFDLLIYGLFAAGGPKALVLFSALTFAGGIALLLSSVRRFLSPLSSSWLLLSVVFVAQQRFSIRPEMVSLLLLPALLFVLDRVRARGWRPVWPLPLLILLWVNAHALFVVGLLAIASAGLWALLSERLPFPDGWRDRSLRDLAARRRLILTLGLSVGVTLLNPYGFRGARFPLELPSRFDKGSAYRFISEFNSPFDSLFANWSLGAFQLLFAIGVAVALLAALLTLRSRSTVKEDHPVEAYDVAGLLLFVALAYLAVLARRNTALFVVGSAPFIARCLRIIGSRLELRRWRPGSWLSPAAAVVTATLMALAGWAVCSNEYYRADGKTHAFGAGILDVRFPIRATAFFDSIPLPEPVYSDMSSGGYLTWARPGGGGVYIDGRLEVYDQLFEEYIAGLGDPEIWAAQAERWKIRSAIVSHRPRGRHRLIRWLLASPDWAHVYHDEVAIVFVRRRGHEAEILRARSDFAQLDSATRDRLLSPSSGWGYPHERALELGAYARLLDLIGDRDGAARFFTRALDLGLLSREALSYHLWLARHALAIGDIENVRRQLEAARAIDPDHPQLQEPPRRPGS